MNDLIELKDVITELRDGFDDVGFDRNAPTSCHHHAPRTVTGPTDAGCRPSGSSLPSLNCLPPPTSMRRVGELCND